MAYLDTSPVFSSSNVLPVAIPDDVATTLSEPAGFAPTEWTVILLARQDSVTTLSEPRRSWLGRLLFGQPRTYNLAAERLEALRRLAVEAWHQPLAISLTALGGFIAAGFTSSQLSLLFEFTAALPALRSQTTPAFAAADERA